MGYFPLKFWFFSTMMQMEKVEMMDAMIILAGIVALKVMHTLPYH